MMCYTKLLRYVIYTYRYYIVFAKDYVISVSVYKKTYRTMPKTLWHSAVSLFIHATIMLACNNLHMTDMRAKR